jgi:hypothetical protein
MGVSPPESSLAYHEGILQTRYLDSSLGYDIYFSNVLKWSKNGIRQF